MHKHILFLLFLSFSLPITAQESAEEIFKKATDQLLLNNLELSIAVKETNGSKRVKEKSFKVLMAKFGATEKTKTIVEKPERAKGVTIVITKKPSSVGLIEILTPANGKVRKLKATPKNIELVGAGSPLSNFTSKNLSDLQCTSIGKKQIDGKSCHVIAIKEHKETNGSKAEFFIDVSTYRIIKIVSYDEKEEQSVTHLSNYENIEGLKGKIYPKRIISKTDKNKKETEIIVLSVNARPNVKEEDFKI